MIAIALTARPSYARVKTVLEGLRNHDLPFQVLVSGGALLRDYGQIVDEVRDTFGSCVRTLVTVVAGDALEMGALSTAMACDAYTRAFAADRPSLVVAIADRREVLGATIAASYQGIPVLHLLAGERSGAIDDAVRGAITALSTYQAVPHALAANLVRRQLGDRAKVRVTGCPSYDLIARGLAGPPVTCAELGGTGPILDLQVPFDVVLLHPDTRDLDASPAYAHVILESAIRPQVILWPGEDPGSQAIAKVYRQAQQIDPHARRHFVRHVPAERFYRLLGQATRLVGNSSVGVREATAIPGLEIVTVGHRQDDRVTWQQADGQAGARVVEWLEEILHAVPDSRPGRLRACPPQEYPALSAGRDDVA